MCNYTDTKLGIKKLDFSQKRGKMAVYLTDGREVIVPVGLFPEIKFMEFLHIGQTLVDKRLVMEQFAEKFVDKIVDYE